MEAVSFRVKEPRDREGKLIIYKTPFTVEKIKEKIFILVGPSGVGKSTLIKKIGRDSLPNKRPIPYIPTYTNRARRYNPETGPEIHGVHKYFVSLEEFIELKDSEFFAEWEEVYEGCFYGTSYNGLYEAAKNYRCGIMDLDIHGAKALKQMFPKNIHTIFIRPQKPEQLIEQLRYRSEQDGVPEKKILQRIERFEKELAQQKEFDSLVTNISGNVQHAADCIIRIINDRLNSLE